MYRESEIVDLLLVVFLTPIMAASIRAIRISGKRWFVAGYLSIVTGFVFTVIEGYILPDAFNVLEHLAYATGGVCFAVAAHLVSRAVRTRGSVV